MALIRGGDACFGKFPCWLEEDVARIFLRGSPLAEPTKETLKPA